MPLNRVWFSRSWVLNRVYDFTIKRLEQGFFLDWKSYNGSWFCIQNKANQGRKVVSPALDRLAKWEVFVLNRIGVCGPRRHTSTQISLEYPSPPPPPGLIRRRVLFKGGKCFDHLQYFTLNTLNSCHSSQTYHCIILAPLKKSFLRLNLLPYLAYAGMCPWTGYGFQGLESWTGYTISQLSVLNMVSFWTGSLSMSVKTCDERPTFAIIFFPKHLFLRF